MTHTDNPIKTNSTGLNNFERIGTVAFATLLAEIITQPICTVKTNYQISKMTTFQTTKYIHNSFGLKGFFMASKPAIISQILSTTSKFTIYEKLKEHRHTEKNDLFNNSINGIISGIIGCTITHPVDVWKNFNQRGQSMTNYLKSSVKTNTLIPSLYRGYSGSLGKNIILYSSLFPLNDYFKDKFGSTMISAPLTTIIMCMVLQPIDYYKTVVMAGQKPTNFFRGTHLIIGRSIPHFFLTMYLTEIFRDKIIQNNTNNLI